MWKMDNDLICMGVLSEYLQACGSIGGPPLVK